MSTEYGTAHFLRTDYDGRTRILSVVLIDPKGDWGHIPEHLRIVAADAIVIDRAELPEVTANGPDNFAFSTGAGMSTWGGKTASEARVEARELLALAEYLAAHPPVPPVSDEDVETLADLIRRHTNGGFASDIARRLLATGKVEVRP